MNFKKIALLSGLFLFCFVSGFAQEKLDFKEKASLQLLYDFGQIQNGDKVRYIFKVANASKTAWKIGKIVSSCGCVSAELILGKEDDKVIKPGESFAVKIEVDTDGHTGRLEQFVYLNIAQGAEDKLLKLIVEGEVTK